MVQFPRLLQIRVPHVLLGFGRYIVTEDNLPNTPYLTSFSQDGTGVMNLDETKTCAI